MKKYGIITAMQEEMQEIQKLMKEISFIEIYGLNFIEGKIINSNTYENIENLKFTVIIDEVNQAFAVIPEIINDENYNYNLTIEYDNENYYNEYNYKNYSEAEIFTEYFNYYKELAIKIDRSNYNDFIDKINNYSNNQSLQEELEYLDELENGYGQLNEMQCRFRSI